jgi:(p)ppGpp synthase/HD superfamily hydrolase
MRKIETALDIAIRAHDNVIDKAGKPYILHPLAVMMSKTPDLIGVPGSPMRSLTPDEMCVAILHDVIEDCDDEFCNEIVEKFYEYPEIIIAINAISKCKGECLSDYYRRVMTNPMSHRIKLLDMEHNMSYERIVCITDPATRARLTKKYNTGYATLTSI